MKTSITELRRITRNMRTWNRDKAIVTNAVNGLTDLNLFQRDAAASHLFGGMLGTLANEGVISRTRFIQLLVSAREFGLKIRV